jgi:Flp pilus assembly protein TadB
MKSIEERLKSLEARNKRVEAEKSWEVSWTRRIAIAVLTYLVVVAYLFFIVRIDPWLNAIVPVMGFLLSTLTISYLKSRWIKRLNK